MPVSELPDDDLVRQVASGDERSLLALYDRHAGRVHALARWVLGEAAAAEEVTQDVFLKVWQHAASYSPQRGSFLNWLLTITRRTAIDRLRQEKRQPPAASAEDLTLLWQNITEASMSPDEARWRALYFALQGLPSEQRQVIELAYYQGMSHSQIAEHLEWPVGTVKTRLRLGMEALRRQWIGPKDG